MAIDDCIRGVREILKGELDEKQINQIAKEVQRRARQIRERSNAQAEADVLAEAAASVTDDVQKAVLIERRNKSLNILAFDRAMNRIQAGLDQGLTLRESIAALTVGTEGRVFEGRRSVYSNANARFKEYLSIMVDDLERSGHLEVLTKRKGREGQGEGYLDLDIAKEMWAVSAGQDSVTGNPAARKVAEIFHNAQERARLDQNRVGAAIGKRPDYIVRQTHDQGRIGRVDEQEWIDFILPLLDESTFDDVAPRTFLRNVRKNIIFGKHYRAPDAAPHDISFTGPANLAKKVSAQRELHFKDAESWYRYNQRFGTSSLIENFIRGLDRAAEHTALMETFGPNPRAMFERILDAVDEKYYDGDPPLSRHVRKVLMNEFAEIDGTTRQVDILWLAHFGTWVRAVQSWAKLGFSVLTSVTDVGSSISDLRWQRGSHYEAFTGYLREGMRFSPDARKQAMVNGIGLEGLIGEVALKHNADDNIPGTVARINRLYYKLNVLAPWTDGRKQAINRVMAWDLASDLKGKTFDELNPKFRQVMEAYGIGEAEWRAMKNAEMRAVDGRDYFTVDAVRRMDAEALRPILGDKLDTIDADIAAKRAALEEQLANAKSDDARTSIQNKMRPLEAHRARRRNAAIDRARDELANKVFTFYVDRADAGVPTPGARERAVINRGTMRGEPLGEFMRFVGHLKMFSITSISRNLVRDIGAHGLRAALREGRGDLVGLASHIAMLTIFGMMAQQLKEMARGKTPKPIYGENAAQAWTAALLQGGGLGIYGDLLLQNYNVYGRSPQEALLGPGFSAMADVLKLAQAPFTEEEDFASQLNRTVQTNTPGINLFYTKAALDYLILWRINEWVSPGYARRLENRTEDAGQEYYIPSPTEVVD